jgi:hypothetical protein
MSVDYNSCAGIGIEISEGFCTASNLDGFWDYIKREGLVYGLYLYAEAQEHPEPNFIEAERGGDSYSEEERYYLFASDPIHGISDYILEMYDLFGLELSKDDLKFISEVRIS